MSKLKIVGIAIATVMAATLVAGTIFVIKNINEKPPTTVNQQSNPSSAKQPQNTITPAVHTSVFEGVDDIHWGKGTATITASQGNFTLSFKEDFEVAQGPDLFVYLSPNPAGQELGEYASLGTLKATKGTQEYMLPSNYQDYQTVIIWCRALNVTFATAEFDFN